MMLVIMPPYKTAATRAIRMSQPRLFLLNCFIAITYTFSLVFLPKIPDGLTIKMMIRIR